MSDKITIAQALRRIKKLKGQIAEHTLRAQQGVSYEQNKVPAFRFAEAVASMKLAQHEMIDLQSRVAIANAKSTVLDQGESITHAEAIRRLQELKGEISFLKSLNLRNETLKNREQEWSDEKNIFITRFIETVWLSDLTEQDRDTQVRSLQDHFELLNNIVEDRNHKIAI